MIATVIDENVDKLWRRQASAWKERWGNRSTDKAQSRENWQETTGCRTRLALIRWLQVTRPRQQQERDKIKDEALRTGTILSGKYHLTSGAERWEGYFLNEQLQGMIQWNFHCKHIQNHRITEQLRLDGTSGHLLKSGQLELAAASRPVSVLSISKDGDSTAWTTSNLMARGTDHLSQPNDRRHWPPPPTWWHRALFRTPLFGLPNNFFLVLSRKKLRLLDYLQVFPPFPL